MATPASSMNCAMRDRRGSGRGTGAGPMSDGGVEEGLTLRQGICCSLSMESSASMLDGLAAGLS